MNRRTISRQPCQRRPRVWLPCRPSLPTAEAGSTSQSGHRRRKRMALAYLDGLNQQDSILDTTNTFRAADIVRRSSDTSHPNIDKASWTRKTEALATAPSTAGPPAAPFLPFPFPLPLPPFFFLSAGSCKERIIAGVSGSREAWRTGH